MRESWERVAEGVDYGGASNGLLPRLVFTDAGNVEGKQITVTRA